MFPVAKDLLLSLGECLFLVQVSPNERSPGVGVYAPVIRFPVPNVIPY